MATKITEIGPHALGPRGYCVETHIVGKWRVVGYFRKDDLESAIEAAFAANMQTGYPVLEED